MVVEESGLSNLMSVESMYDFLLLCNSEWLFLLMGWVQILSGLRMQTMATRENALLHCMCFIHETIFNFFVQSRVIVVAQGLVQVGAMDGCRQFAIGKIAKCSLHWM